MYAGRRMGFLGSTIYLVCCKVGPVLSRRGVGGCGGCVCLRRRYPSISLHPILNGNNQNPKNRRTKIGPLGGKLTAIEKKKVGKSGSQTS